ncbi:MAG TPA: rod shape-determining protein MreC [Ferruginibacter sp.]|mgnify:CR=1 FL=1|nr:rod shape-determining protein MreC [Ferruginibacter sp.]HMP19539.1 rod shape-determining protein MreC [Ferruginibacter sp.]
MRNVFFFIRRYFNFIFFLLLQAGCIIMIAHYNRYHNAIASGYMNEITGRINQQYNKADNFLQLGKSNKALTEENEKLRNLLPGNFHQQDTVNKIVKDSIPYDTLGHRRVWQYKAAKVVSNSVTAQNNYIVLGRGSNQQLQKDAGVIDPLNGVVGIVTEVSPNFAVVMSLLHKDSRISAKLKNGGDAGQVIWDGLQPNRLQLIDIKKSAKVAKGDTILTSGFTTTFPYGMIIGTVDEVRPDKGSSNYIIFLKSAANFYNLQYVYSIENLQKDEINQLLEKTKAKSAGH